MTLLLNSVVVEVINKKGYFSAQLQAQTIMATSLAAPEVIFAESHKMYRTKPNHTEHNFLLHGPLTASYKLLPIHVGAIPASAVCFHFMPPPYSFPHLLVLLPLLTVFSHFLPLIL